VNRLWAIGVGLVILTGLTILVIARPVQLQPDPEARAMEQLRYASIRPAEVLFLRTSSRDPNVVCGRAVIGPASPDRHEADFVSLPARMTIGRVGHPAVFEAQTRYCPGMFPVESPPTP